MKTYDIYFIGNSPSKNIGLEESLEFCKEYIHQYNGTSHPYFDEFRGGVVEVICNETGELAYSETIRTYYK